jgi:predicted nucleic acid-binding protein
MPSDLIYYYWDACVPLSYINGVPDRLQHIDAFMHKSGVDFQLITSVLSITEVAFATCEKDAKTLDPEVEAKISKLWQAGSPIKIVEFYELIAVKAQQLMRAALAHGWSLKPPDAIHLATADQLGVKEFHTYDTQLCKFSVLTDSKFPIVAPISATPFLPLAEVKPETITESTITEVVAIAPISRDVPIPEPSKPTLEANVSSVTTDIK